MVFEGKIAYLGNQSAPRGQVGIGGGDQYHGSSRLLVQNQQVSNSVQKLVPQRFKRNALQSIDSKESTGHGRNDVSNAPSTPSRKRAAKKYKLSYDNINKTAIPDKSPEFAVRFNGGDGSGPSTDNITLTDHVNNKSVDSQSNIVKTGTDRKMNKRQLVINHEMLARPQLAPINSHATIGREDHTNSKERH